MRAASTRLAPIIGGGAPGCLLLGAHWHAHVPARFLQPGVDERVVHEWRAPGPPGLHRGGKPQSPVGEAEGEEGPAVVLQEDAVNASFDLPLVGAHGLFALFVFQGRRSGWGNDGHESRQIANGFFFRLMDPKVHKMIAELRRHARAVVLDGQLHLAAPFAQGSLRPEQAGGGGSSDRPQTRQVAPAALATVAGLAGSTTRVRTAMLQWPVLTSRQFSPPSVLL